MRRSSGPAILLIAVSLYLYVLYQQGGSLAVGLSSVSLFAVGSYLLLEGLRFLGPLARMLPFILVGATASLALVSLDLQTYIDGSSYSALLATASARFTALLMTASGVSVHVSGDVLFFPDARALSIGAQCGGAYSTILFMLLSMVLVADFGKRAPKRRLAVALALGVLGANIANVFRITFLAEVMYFYGLGALEVVHQFAGYAIFLGFVATFWMLALSWLSGSGGYSAGLRP